MSDEKRDQSKHDEADPAEGHAGLGEGSESKPNGATEPDASEPSDPDRGDAAEGKRDVEAASHEAKLPGGEANARAAVAADDDKTAGDGTGDDDQTADDDDQTASDEPVANEAGGDEAKGNESADGAAGGDGPDGPDDDAKADGDEAEADDAAGGKGGGADEWDDLSQPAGGYRPPTSQGAAWGRPLAKVDAVWTRFESRLCAVVLILEVLSLSLWVGLKGMSDPADSGSNAGIVFRALTGAILLAMAGYFGLYKQPLLARRIAAIIGVAVGVFTAKYWANFGVEWASNLLNWYQQASSLTLLGGLRGVGTRLTLLLALLGGSLATAAGKHITIDLITRFANPKARMPMVVFGWLASSVIVFSAAWGFFDHIAIEDFGAKAEATASEKFSKVGEGLGENFFIARKQLLLDFKSLPHVMKGEPYYDWLNGKEWNAWLADQGFVERYGEEKVKPLRLPEDGLRSPIIVVPEKGEPRGELIHTFNLVFPIGLLIIAIRFILLSLLAVSGHMVIDPEAHIEGADIKTKYGDNDDVLEEKS